MNITNTPLPTKVIGRHRWAAIVGHSLSDEVAHRATVEQRLDLDESTVFRFAITCLDCDQGVDRHTPQCPAPGFDEAAEDLPQDTLDALNALVADGIATERCVTMDETMLLVQRSNAAGAIGVDVEGARVPMLVMNLWGTTRTDAPLPPVVALMPIDGALEFLQCCAAALAGLHGVLQHTEADGG